MPAIWSVQDAKAKLSEVLRRAREDGPQTIGTVNPCIVITKKEWEAWERGRPSLSAWLLTETPQGDAIPVPDRSDPPRSMPFENEDR